MAPATDTADLAETPDGVGITAPRYGAATLEDTKVTTKTVNTGPKIHWGTVLKGVAVVAAVAVAVVVVTPLIVHASAYLFHAAASSPVLAPVVVGIQSAGTAMLHGISWLGTNIASFAGSFWHTLAPHGLHLFGGHAAAAVGTHGVTHLAPVLNAHQIGVASNAMGTLGTGAILGAGAIALKSTLAHGPLMDASSHAVVTTVTPPAPAPVPSVPDQTSLVHNAPAPDAIPSTDPNFASNLLANKGNIASAEAAHQAAETAHHAAEAANHHTVEHDRHAHAMVHQARAATNAWADRVGGSQVEKSAAPAPRDASFIKQLGLDADKAKLDTALVQGA